jgi:two-component system NtrC family sensor kinase
VKRKFILGISILAIIFVLFGIFLFQSLKSISKYQMIKNDHQSISARYLEILTRTQKTLVDLYQYKSGFKKEFDTMVNDVLHTDTLLSEMRNNLENYELNPVCNECHNDNYKNSHKIDFIYFHQERFKNALSPVITSLNFKQVQAYQDEALREGNSIVSSISDMLNEWGKMNTDMRTEIEMKMIQIENILGIFFFITVVASIIIVLLIIRSLSNPINKLVAGINMISAGRLDSKVDITSNDEFGYIAKNFNAMTENLKISIRDRDEATHKLNEVNRTLEQRIFLKTQQLKKAHDNLLRTEGLAIAGTIASSIAHELATPLSTIMGYCEIMTRKIPEENGATSYCTMIQKEIERCSLMMKGMLNLTRISREDKSLIDINATLTDVLFFLSLQTKCNNISVKDDMDSLIPHIIASEIGIRQVFINIIMNAIHSMPDGGNIFIETSFNEAEKTINVRISDTGSGINETDMGKIFKSFFTTKESGTGLGLSICYAIIQAHEGNIEARSEIGKGTTFEIILPVKVQ